MTTLTPLEAIAIINGVAHAGRQDWQATLTGAESYRGQDTTAYRWLDEPTLIRVAMSYQMEFDAAARNNRGGER